jgi:ubiquinone/menaquinone biosynthesis C-methylase UbiE
MRRPHAHTESTVPPQEAGAYHQPGVLRVLQSKSETKAFYNKIAKVYDLLAEHTEAPVRQAGLDLLSVQRGEKVLEIGFGTGHSLAALAQSVGPSGRVFGIDVSEEMSRLATERLRERGLANRAELRSGDAAHLPYGAATMDAIFMSFTLELFDTPEIPVVLGECKRVLRPGGRIVVIGMSRVKPDGVLTEVFEWTHRHFPNYLDCRPILVRRAMEDAGFQINKASIQSMWIPVEIVLGVNPVRARR